MNTNLPDNWQQVKGSKSLCPIGHKMHIILNLKQNGYFQLVPNQTCFQCNNKTQMGLSCDCLIFKCLTCSLAKHQDLCLESKWLPIHLF